MIHMNAPNIHGPFWHTVPRGWKDVARCLAGRHVPVTWGWVDTFTAVERCSCGAINWNGLGWEESKPFTRRKAKDEENGS